MKNNERNEVKKNANFSKKKEYLMSKTTNNKTSY